jgi:hypothetical protein
VDINNDDMFIREYRGGWKHPDRTFEEQTEIFIAAVQFLYEMARKDYVDLRESIGRPVTDAGERTPPLTDPANPDVLCAFEYGRVWQAAQTTRSFAAQLGMEGYEDDMVVDYVPPVPDDPSSLYE